MRNIRVGFAGRDAVTVDDVLLHGVAASTARRQSGGAGGASQRRHASGRRCQIICNRRRRSLKEEAALAHRRRIQRRIQRRLRLRHQRLSRTRYHFLIFPEGFRRNGGHNNQQQRAFQYCSHLPNQTASIKFQTD